ncbi:MAG: PEP-CTERM sorting domain-containing protein [Gemmatirosa sp.]
MRAFAALASLALAAALSPLGAQTQTIDTRTGQPAHGVWIYMGPTWAQLAGQTFVAPVGMPVIQSASLWAINLGDEQSAFTFEAVLQGFDPETFTFTGSALYTSGAQTATTYLGAGHPERFDFDLGGIALDEGASYAFLARRIGGVGGLGYHPASTPYADGLPVWTYSAAPGAAVYRDTHDYESAFVATFTAPERTADDPASPSALTPISSTVPEPSTYALLGSGMLMLGGVAMRRRRNVA